MPNYLQQFLKLKRESESDINNKKTFIENLYKPNYPLPGSTLTPETATTNKLFVNSIEFMGNEDINNVVEGISHDYLEKSKKLLPSSRALYEALTQLRFELEAIDPNNNFLKDNTVITLPLALFSNKTIWDMTSDWVFFGDKAIYTKREDSNYLKLTKDAFTRTGYYIFDIDVDEIASGYLEVVDYKGEVIGEIREKGETVIEVFIANTEIATFKIIAKEVYGLDKVIINRVGLHFVTDRFRDYLNYRLRNIHPFGGNELGLTEDLVIQIVKDTILLDIQNVLRLIDNTNDKIDLHVTSRDNPHGVTIEQIRAASEDHTHVEFNEIQKDLDRFNLHVGDNQNPHNVTCGQIGASLKDHNHDGIYADVEHYHEQYLEEEAVKKLITEGVKDYLNGLQEEDKEDEDTPNLITQVYPYSLILSNPKYLGDLPFDSFNLNLTKPSDIVITPFLEHLSNSKYDYRSGIISCNIYTDEHNPIWYAFKHHLNKIDFIINVASFNSFTNNKLEKDVNIEYKFFSKRKIRGYTVYKDSTNKIKGYATKWKVLADNKVVQEIKDKEWCNLDSGGGSKHVVFEEGIELEKISFLVEEINGMYDDVVQVYRWGIRIEIEFDDVELGEIKIKDPITLIYNNYTKHVVEDIKTVVDIREDNSPIYLFVKMNKEVNKEDKVEFKPELITKLIKPELSYNKEGVSLFLDKFKEKENLVYGDILSDSESIDHVVQNIYSSEDNYFRTENNCNKVIIEHDFKDKYNLLGYKIWFLNEFKDHIPNNWTIEYTLEDDSIIEEVFENYCIPIVDSKYIIVDIKKKIDNVKSYRITFNKDNEDTPITIARLDILGSDYWYNPYTTNSTDNSLFPIGKVEFIRSEINNKHSYRVMVVPCGKSVRLPVNDFKLTKENKKFKIDNPFLTKDVTVNTLVDGLLIESIDEDYIVVRTTKEDRYAIEVLRNF